MATPATLTVPVERLRSVLCEAEQAAAKLREDADAAARRLVTSPSHEAMAAKRRLEDELELQRHVIEKLKADLEQAKLAGYAQVADQAEREQDEAKAEAKGIEEQLRASLHKAQADLIEFMTLRDRCRELDKRKVSHRMAVNGEQWIGNNPPPMSVCLHTGPEMKKWLEQMSRDVDKCLWPY